MPPSLVAAFALPLALALTAGALPAGGSPRPDSAARDTAVEAALDRCVRDGMQSIYGSRLVEATRFADEALALAPRDPRVHILRARLLRETFPDQNARGDDDERFAAPIHAALERAIQLCDSLVGDDEKSMTGHLYRGWAHLFRAQMHTLCGEYWSAGGQARSGKRDLDRALELDPENLDAQAVLGTYLYFADILPGVIKLARTIVRVPGGDRRRGLELLRRAAAGDGYGSLDARALVAVIDFAFEGDFAAAERGFESFLRDYPDNPRLREPLAALDLVRPQPDGLERTAAVARLHAASPEGWNRQLAQRLQLYEALGEIVAGRLDAAEEHLEALRRDGPRLPDWFPGSVRLALAEVHLLRGRIDAAQAIYRESAKDERLERRLRFVRQPGAVATFEEAATLQQLQPAARALHAADLETAARALAELGAVDDPGAHFYRGELARLANDRATAERHYAALLLHEVPARWRLFKVLAFARLAELRGAAGDAGAAARLLERGLEFDDDRDLVRHLLRARHRWFAAARAARVEPPGLPAAAEPAAAADGGR